MTDAKERQPVLTSIAIGKIGLRSLLRDPTDEMIDEITERFLIGFLAGLETLSPDITIKEIFEAIHREYKERKTNDQA